MFSCQDELIYMLRKLLLNIGDLPAQTSHILFNYLVSRRVDLPPLLIRLCRPVASLNRPLSLSSRWG